MRIGYPIAALLWISAPAIAATPMLAVQAQDGPTSSAKQEDEAKALVDKAAALVVSRRPAEALPLLDAAIAAEEKVFADEKRQIFCAHSVAESLLYAGMGAKMKKETVVLGPTWSTAVFLKGFALIDVGRADEAGAYLQRAVELSPSRAQFLAELGEWHKARKEWTKSYELFLRASEAADLTQDAGIKDFEKRRALRGMGFVLIEQGKLDEAETFFRRCLEMDPNDARARNELEYIRQLRTKSKGSKQAI